MVDINASLSPLVNRGDQRSIILYCEYSVFAVSIFSHVFAIAHSTIIMDGEPRRQAPLPTPHPQRNLIRPHSSWGLVEPTAAAAAMFGGMPPSLIVPTPNNGFGGGDVAAPSGLGGPSYRSEGASRIRRRNMPAMDPSSSRIGSSSGGGEGAGAGRGAGGRQIITDRVAQRELHAEGRTTAYTVMRGPDSGAGRPGALSASDASTADPSASVLGSSGTRTRTRTRPSVKSGGTRSSSSARTAPAPTPAPNSLHRSMRGRADGGSSAGRGHAAMVVEEAEYEHNQGDREHHHNQHHHQPPTTSARNAPAELYVMA